MTDSLYELAAVILIVAAAAAYCMRAILAPLVDPFVRRRAGGRRLGGCAAKACCSAQASPRFRVESNPDRKGLKP